MQGQLRFIGVGGEGMLGAGIDGRGSGGRGVGGVWEGRGSARPRKSTLARGSSELLMWSGTD